MSLRHASCILYQMQPILFNEKFYIIEQSIGEHNTPRYLDNVINARSKTRIVAISNKEIIEFIEFRVVCSNYLGYVAMQYQTRSKRTYVYTFARRIDRSSRVSASYYRGYSEVHVSATCNWFTFAKSQTSRAAFRKAALRLLREEDSPS